ncbi:MAG TPA: biosynthetic-type acetolactate synthase large subunit [Gemmatimonadaceae bacterium]|nr:biosynthetic-type acetolactate synthase large subunit [Gemmatimonadaceae bacterium]
MTASPIAPPASPIPHSAPAIPSLTGARVMCEALIREDVEVMFGIPGGAIMPFYHAMWEYRDQLRHVLCRHEQGAGHAAEGYARSTGKPGVCVATSGPGATNLVTPIANAWMDSTPLVAITGQVSSAVLGKDAFQETDITGITLPITKHNYRVTRADDLPGVFREAFHIARTGRPGPVLIDVTKDAQQAPVVPDWDVSLNVPGFRAPLGIDSRAVRDAARLLTGAAKPLILAGQGVIISGATAELRALAERTGTPVVTTLHGIGAFPENHPLSIGMPGMHGWVHVNRAIQECDVLLSIGARFDDRVTGKASTFAPRARVIHIDVDPSEIGKNVKVAVAIVADARCALTALLGELPASDSVDEMSGRRAVTWLRNIRETQATHQHRQPYMRRPDTSELMPHDVYAALDAELNERGEYRVVTDVGQHQMWAAQLIEWRRPRTHITSGGAGTMGFAVPAAMGAAIANPGETIWAIVGDGGFQMTNQELATISQEGVRNVKVAIVNNGYLGMVRQWQQLFEGRRYSGTPLSGPSFAGLAEAYGLRGFTIDRIENAREAIRAAWDHDGSAVLDFRVEREANVFPLVPPGSSIGEMITRESAPA